MNPSSKETTHAVVKKVETNCATSSSRKVYLNSISKFLINLCQCNQSCLQENFLKELEEMGGNNRKNNLKLSNEGNIVPVHYEKFKSDEFVKWVVGLKTPEGTYLQFDAMNTHCAAF